MRLDAVAIELEHLVVAGGAPLRYAVQATADAMHVHIRTAMSRRRRQRDGIFFTPPAMADRLVAHAPLSVHVHDPACGCGDLLVAMSRRLPTAGSVADTLAEWGRWLSGTDIHPAFVRIARARLVIEARRRHDAWDPLPARIVRGACQRVVVGDGLADGRQLPIGTAVIMNPPYVMMAARPWVMWGAGQVNAAAVFVDHLQRRLRDGGTLHALLPDVLRSGGRYRQWRLQVARSAYVNNLDVFGRFDAWTDVDVFALHATCGPQCSAIWPEPILAYSQTHAAYQVCVGPVIPHRHAERGPPHPYLVAQGLRHGTEIRGLAMTRPFAGRVIAPPFVVIKRTTSPKDRRRVVGAIVRGRRSVAVENHLIICRPTSRRVSDCKRLLRRMASAEMQVWLNATFRCRHLTVAAVQAMLSRLRSSGWSEVSAPTASHPQSARGRVTVHRDCLALNGA